MSEVSPGSFHVSHVQAWDGLPLQMRCCWGSRPTVFVGHGPTVHSGFTLDFGAALGRAGWTVYAGDLRGHGGSISDDHPLGHLDPQRGWDDLIEDMRVMLAHAFAGVPWQERLVVGPSISGLLVLEVLKGWPDLARQIVLVSPTPRQPALMTLARGFVRMRMVMMPAANQPDPQIQHHLFSFLGAHLKNRHHLADIISADRAMVNAVLRDPQGFPTHTLGYWASIFAGNERVWQCPSPMAIPPETRVLVLYGSEDSQMRSGMFAPMVVDWLRSQGIPDVSAQVVQGARSNVLIDENRLGVSAQVLDWLQDPSSARSPAPVQSVETPSQDPDVDIRAAYENALITLGMAEGEDRTSESLVGLCYAALDDEDRWNELLYTLALVKDPDSGEAQQIIGQVLPHLGRSFELRQQLLSQASLGDLMGTLVERLDIGVALLNSRGSVLHCNEPYRAALTRLLTPTPKPQDITSLTQQLLQHLDRDPRRASPSVLSEQLVVYEGHPVGLLFRPRALKQKILSIDGPSQMLVLRASANDLPDFLYRVQLLELAYGLTRQEGVVAMLVAQGGSTDEIAAELSVSIHTVRTHLKRCFDKMSVTSRTELATRLLSGPIGWLCADRQLHQPIKLPASDAGSA